MGIGVAKYAIPVNGVEVRQILKESGYFTITLHSVHYRTRGNLFQRVFGGSDRIAVTCRVAYSYGAEKVVATSLQDVRKVSAPASHYLGLSRQIALKLPADSDNVELTVEISSIADDNATRVLRILNTDEFRRPLELAAPVLGHIALVTSFVNRLLPPNDERQILALTYAPILSYQTVATPVVNGRLVAGFIVVVAVSDGALEDLDPDKFELVGDTLRHDGAPLDATYVIFNITHDAVRGPNPRAEWYGRFQAALARIDSVVTADPEVIAEIRRAAEQLWIEGGALLDADALYLQSERDALKETFLAAIRRRLEDRLTTPPPPAPRGEDVTPVAALDLRPALLDKPLDELAAAARQYRDALRAARVEDESLPAM